MRCAACEHELEAFTGDVCPKCQHFAHPTKLGIYDGLELIKRGGMGSVYRARHPELGTIVAIKTVHTHTGPEMLAERFEQEARLAARIPHPGVVRVFDYDCQEGRLYLVMEFVDGETLRPVIESDSRDIAWRLDKIAQLLEILHTAHEQGIVHRDIKPENVMVDSTGRVRVLDFGISRVLDDGERLTQTGEILGTPEYISPEQILDVPEAVDARTDIYATGVVLYELLTGRSPFAGSNLFQVLKKVESLDPPPPSQLRSGIEPELDALVMECMAKDREQRPADARRVGRRLREMLPAGVAPRPAQRKVWSATIVACLVMGWLASAWWSGNHDGAPAQAAEVQRRPVPTIRAILGGEQPFDRAALTAMSKGIEDGAGAEALFWRGLARKHTGALLLALRDFEASRNAGFEEARKQAAVLWVYKYKLIPLVFGADFLAGAVALDVPGDDAFARCFESLAREDYKAGLEGLRQLGSAVPPADMQVLVELCKSRLSGKSTLEAKGGVYVPLRLLAAALIEGGRTQSLSDILMEIDRLAPTRYLIEAAIAARDGDEPRLRSALELAQVTGEADFAMTVFVAVQIGHFDQLDRASRSKLSRIAAELKGPLTRTVLKGLENLNGK